MMTEISALTNVYWYMGMCYAIILLFCPCLDFSAGVPFNDTQNWRLGIAEVGEAMLGKYLIGLQVCKSDVEYHGL